MQDFEIFIEKTLKMSVTRKITPGSLNDGILNTDRNPQLPFFQNCNLKDKATIMLTGNRNP